MLEVCFAGGFRKVLLRGDTDFTQTKHLDRWSDDPRVRFIFGIDCTPKLAHAGRRSAGNGLETAGAAAALRRCRPSPERGRRTSKKRSSRSASSRTSAWCAKRWPSSTTVRRRASKTYRMIVVRKYLEARKGQAVLFDDYRYFFYLTNDRNSSAAEVVFEANDRCDQENLHAQLKGGVRCVDAPVDNLVSNWAYMVMTSLAWNLKAWWALLLPEPRRGAAGRAAARGEAARAADGVQDVPERLDAVAVSDRATAGV